MSLRNALYPHPTRLTGMFSNNSSIALYVIEMPFNTFADKADPDQVALVRAA